MNWVQFKDPVTHMCLAGTVVASWHLTQEVNTRNQQQNFSPMKIEKHGLPGF